MNRFVRWMALLVALAGGTVAACAQTAAVQNHCTQGGVQANVSGLPSTNYLNGIIPSCTVTVYLTGTQTKATIYADGSNTPLSNPFTANTQSSTDPGGYKFWAAVNQGYDIVMSGGVSPNVYRNPVTLVGVYPGFSFSPEAGVTSINGVAGSFTFDGGAVSCAANDCTFSQTTLQTNGTPNASQGTLNFSNTTPAAPAGAVNVSWQNSTSNESAYIPAGAIPGAQCFLGLTGLVGAFTDGSGVIKEALCIGNGPITFQVPSGATQLILGVNDDKFADNTGSWSINVAVNGGTTTPVTVNGTMMPWSITTNPTWTYGINDGTTGVVAATGLTALDSVTLTYVSGTVWSGNAGYPFVDANGSISKGTTGSGKGSTGTFFPTYYMSGSWSGGAITGLTGDGTATGPGVVRFTLATVNSSPGTCGDSTHVCQITTDGKGRTTAQAAVPITASSGVTQITGPASTVTGAITFTGAGVSQSGSTFTFTSSGGISEPVSPVAEWPMTDGSGTTVTDISGNGNNGTLSASAPAWVSGGGLHFNGTLAAPVNEYVSTPITTFGSVVMNICPDPLAATSGTSTGGPFYAQFPTIWAPSGTTANGLILLSGSALTNKYQGAFSPSIFANSGGTFKTSTDYGVAGCYNIGYSLGASDHIYINGVEMAYTTQGVSSSLATTTGTYAIGSNGTSTGNNANAFVGYINYAVVFSSALTAAQQLQESQYINYKLLLRSNYPEVAASTRTTRQQQVIFLGDSLTAGYEGTGIWTNFVAPSPVSGTYTYVNWGLASDEAATESSMLPYRAGTQISRQGKSYVFVWLGTNDCADGGYTPAGIWSNLQSIARQITALGGLPIAVTMISRTGQETCRGVGSGPQSSPLGLNDYIRTYWRRAGFAGLLDLAEQSNLGANNANTNATYFNADHIHLTGGNACNTTTGYGLVCEGATAELLYLDGYNQSHPYFGTDTSLTLGLNYGYVIENPAAAATYTLPDCTYLTGAEFTIVNKTSSFGFTINPFSGQTISGPTSIAANSSLTYIDTLVSAAAGGCYWTVK